MKQHLMNRFPEHAQAIEDLSLGNAAFGELVHKYGSVVERLRHLRPASKGEPCVEAEGLKKWRGKRSCC